jgi:hypothetical protein
LRAGEAQPVSRPTRSDELRLDTLQVGGQTYTNVRILPQTSRSIVITHAGGMTTINVDDLSHEDAARLGSHIPQADGASVHKTGNQATPGKSSSSSRTGKRSYAQRFADGAISATSKETQESLRTRPDSFRLLFVALVLAIVPTVHLLYAFFLRCICQKAASPAGALVWFPVLQLVPAHRAAGISPWWVLLWPLYGWPAPYLVGALVGTSRWCILLLPVGQLPALYLVGRLCVARGRSFSLVFALVVLPFFATIALLAFRADGSLVLASLVLLAGPYRVFAYPYLALAD